MMLHEAVMLEIYRQALSASELVSPRCHSRDGSSGSVSNAPDARCPSNDSNCSVNESGMTPAQTPTPTSPQASGLSLSTTLTPTTAAAAAAALLPTQSAAMAAYLNVAAAAAVQQNHLLLTNPLAAAATLVQQASVTQAAMSPSEREQISSSPLSAPSSNNSAPTNSPIRTHSNHRIASPDLQSSNHTTIFPTSKSIQETSDALDFSTKGLRDNQDDDDDSSNSEAEAEIAVRRRENLSENLEDVGLIDDCNSPLDLSLNSGRKRRMDDDELIARPISKMGKIMGTATTTDYKVLPSASTWVPPINPYLAAVAAATSLTPKTALSSLDSWVSKANKQLVNNEATRTLEKMTEMTGIANNNYNNTSDSEQRLRRVNYSTCNLMPSTSTVAVTESTTTFTVSGTSGATILSTTPSTTTGGVSGGRHSAWQSHWLTKGADSVKDVFRCVWCKQSFATLASLTAHMKETQHCGVSVPPHNLTANGNNNHSIGTNNNNNNNNQNNTNNTQNNRINVNSSPSIGSNVSDGSNSGTGSTGQGGNSSRHHHNQITSTQGNLCPTTSSHKSDLNTLIKETMPLPRKLVRGQDVWLGKGAEQTRQILKCMWCGQSFRSLAEMTSHMQETQHYTNIISQEQIISWKSSDDKITSSRNNSGSASTSPSGSNVSATNVSTLNAVLTCKVCDQAFGTLKELSNHMVKNNHYKEHMLRASNHSFTTKVSSSSIQQATELGSSIVSLAMPMKNTNSSGEGSANMLRSGNGNGAVGGAIGGGGGRGRQSKEKRKKSLPVRKLLELERAQQDFKNDTSLEQALKPLRDFAASTKITCEKCGEKIETALFVDHIRQCIDNSLHLVSRNYGGNANSEYSSGHGTTTLKSSYNRFESSLSSPRILNDRKMSDGSMTSPASVSMSSSLMAAVTLISSCTTISTTSSVVTAPTTTTTQSLSSNQNLTQNPLRLNNQTEEYYPLAIDHDKSHSSSEGTSVLNALEKLIEKSFETRPRLGSGGGSYGDHLSGGQTPLGASILKRLGIDDTVDYTKPLIDAQTMQFLRSYSNYSALRDRSASESSSVSERCSSHLESFTPERTQEVSRQPTPRLTPESKNTSNFVVSSTNSNTCSSSIGSNSFNGNGNLKSNVNNYLKNEESATKVSLPNRLNIKSEPIDVNEGMSENEVEAKVGSNVTVTPTHHSQDSNSIQKITVKKEFKVKEEQQEILTIEPQHNHAKPNSQIMSPSISERSITPKSNTSTNERKPSLPPPLPSDVNSLNALSSMFNSLTNVGHSTLNSLSSAAGPSVLEQVINGNHKANSNSNSLTHSNPNPLMALQKLCETTDSNTNSHTNSSSSAARNLASQLVNGIGNASTAGVALMTSSYGWNFIGNDAHEASTLTSTSTSLSSSSSSSSSTTGLANIKCSYCDTSFTTKSSYRLHLSKVHFVKDELETVTGCGKANRLRSPGNHLVSNASAKSMISPKGGGMIGTIRSPTRNRSLETNSPSNMMATSTINPYEETPQSKFLKYTELAKQLSSKNS